MDVVNLNLINYEGKEILDKKIMEACGDGAFSKNALLDIREREWTEDIKAGLEECI